MKWIKPEGSSGYMATGEEKRHMKDKRPDCKYYRSGKCIHFEHRKFCHPSDESWFEYAEPLHPTWVDRVCELEDPMQPRMYKITEADIEALRNGQILHIVSPSPFFIAFMDEENPDD